MLFRQVLSLVPFLRRFEAASNILSRYERSDLVTVLLLSGARYLVFAIQFVIILVVMADGLCSIPCLAAIPVAFLFSTLIPTVMLTELGVRGSIAVALISPQLAQDKGVFLASTALWVINIALPALVGSLILLMAHIRTKRVAHEHVPHFIALILFAASDCVRTP